MTHKFHLPGEIQIQGATLRVLFGDNPCPDAILACRKDLRTALELHEEHTGKVPATADDLIWELGVLLGMDPRELAASIMDALADR